MASTSAFDSFANSLSLALPTTPCKSPPTSMQYAPGTPRACSIYSTTPNTPHLDSPSSPFTPSTASSRLFRVVQGALSPLSPSPQCQRMVIDDFSAHRKSLARMSPTMAQKSKPAARPFAINGPSHRRSTSSAFSSDWDSGDDLESEPVLRPSKGRASLPAFGKPAPGVCRKLFGSSSDSAIPSATSSKPRHSQSTHLAEDEEDEEWRPLASARGRLQSRSTECLADIDQGVRGTKRKRL